MGSCEKRPTFRQFTARCEEGVCGSTEEGAGCSPLAVALSPLAALTEPPPLYAARRAASRVPQRGVGRYSVPDLRSGHVEYRQL